MKNKGITAFAALVILSGAAAPHKRASHASDGSQSARCKKMSDNYEDASKVMAVNKAKGLFDNSAIRENMRQTEDGNSLAAARMTLDLMKSAGCKLPTEAPSGDRYFSSAIICEGDRSKMPIDSPPSCDQSKWTPIPN